MVHVAFRSAETGRYLFHVKWPEDEWAKIEAAAAVMGISVEEFVHQAIDAYAKKVLGDSWQLETPST